MSKVNKLLDALFPNFTCVACGAEIQSSPNAYLCEKCAESLPFNMDEDATHFAPFLYEEPIRSVILSLKYSDNGFAARAVAPYMAAVYLKRIKKKSPHVIIPVPLCKSRLHERGYNQSELLAKEIADYLALPIMNDVLIRIKKTTPQKNMTPTERMENMKGAFAVVGDVRGKHILLIDDVYTTGATTGECAKMLKTAGAKTIAILTVATVS